MESCFYYTGILSTVLAPLFTIMAIFILSKMTNIKDRKVFPFVKIIGIISDIAIAYGTTAWIFLYFKTKSLEKTIGLSRDRWHTIYPKTVISIVLSLLFSFFTQSFYFYEGYGIIGIAIVLLGYVFGFQMLSIFV